MFFWSSCLVLDVKSFVPLQSAWVVLFRSSNTEGCRLIWFFTNCSSSRHLLPASSFKLIFWSAVFNNTFLSPPVTLLCHQETSILYFKTLIFFFQTIWAENWSYTAPCGHQQNYSKNFPEQTKTDFKLIYLKKKHFSTEAEQTSIFFLAIVWNVYNLPGRHNQRNGHGGGGGGWRLGGGVCQHHNINTAWRDSEKEQGMMGNKKNNKKNKKKNIETSAGWV